MELSFKNRFSAVITVVANEFIDQYMADANGEYVKVYLYLLRHEGGEITVEAVADALTQDSLMESPEYNHRNTLRLESG